MEKTNIIILHRSPKHPSCNIEKNYEKIEDFENIEDFSTQLEAYYSSDSHFYKILILGKSYEECLEVFFVKDNSLKYCNGSSVQFVNQKDKDAFREHFFGDGGIANYAKCGGDMW